MRWVAVLTALCFLGGVASTIAFIAGAESSAAVAFFLGCLTLVGVFPIVLGSLEGSGSPNHEGWPWQRG